MINELQYRYRSKSGDRNLLIIDFNNISSLSPDKLRGINYDYIIIEDTVYKDIRVGNIKYISEFIEIYGNSGFRKSKLLVTNYEEIYNLRFKFYYMELDEIETFFIKSIRRNKLMRILNKIKGDD